MTQTTEAPILRAGQIWQCVDQRMTVRILDVPHGNRIFYRVLTKAEGMNGPAQGSTGDRPIKWDGTKFLPTGGAYEISFINLLYDPP